MVLTPTLMDTTARGPLRPSLRLRLTPLFCTDPTDTPMPVSMDTPMEDTEPMEPTPTLMDTTARGLLRPRPRLTLLFCTDPTDTPMPVSMDTPMEDTEPME